MYWNEKFRNLVKGYTNMNMNDVATKNQKDFLKVKMFEVPSEVKTNKDKLRINRKKYV